MNYAWFNLNSLVFDGNRTGYMMSIFLDIRHCRNVQWFGHMSGTRRPEGG